MHIQASFSAFIDSHRENSLIFGDFFHSYRELISFKFSFQHQKTILLSNNMFSSGFEWLYEDFESRFYAMKTRNFRKGGATINLNFQICFNFFRKYHELVDLFTSFSVIYNMLQIFTLEHREQLHNVATRFSQLQFFDHYGTFSRFIAQSILLIFFLFERSNISL